MPFAKRWADLSIEQRQRVLKLIRYRQFLKDSDTIGLPAQDLSRLKALLRTKAKEEREKLLPKDKAAVRGRRNP